ncbi:DUF4435 domain-containing protein [Rhizobium leguminosarum]|uniref:DUF4435 domain-containing protein n=1 Tax=Rhizobium leguminosarum TaxID=384 RepID=UPI0010401B7C|nr:DUF4435 domain-containing protein [Rhizobium leguminosarum]TBZ11676.1 DUF4435 domain-containing protein [Rhizobium leguminosarum bv. viciae]
MTMLDLHASALAQIDEAYHEFLLRYDATKKSVYGFVEGKDDPSFYRSVVERFIPEDWSVEFLSSGSRNKVLDTEAAFDWSRFSRRQVAFFIDRDLVHFLNPNLEYRENVYLTDGYAVENSVVTREVFGRLLQEVHNIVDWTEQEKQAVLTHFDAQMSAFQEMLVPIMAQIALWRQQNVRANLNNFDLPSVIRVVDGDVTPCAGREQVVQRVARLCECVGAEASAVQQRDQMEAIFREADGPAKLTRGKYLVWFLSLVANDCHSRINHFVQAYRTPPRPKLTLGANNVMVVAAPRARIPTSLREFLERTFISYIGSRTAIAPA